MRSIRFLLLPLIAMGCATAGGPGDSCETEDDCGDGLHCHIEDGVGVCDDEDEHEEHDDENPM